MDENINSTAIPVPEKRAPMHFGQMHAQGKNYKQTQVGRNTIFQDANGSGRDFSRMDGQQILNIINGQDDDAKRQISQWMIGRNGLYQRVIHYLADILRYDYIIYPNLDLEQEVNAKLEKQILKKFNLVLDYFDSSSLQLMMRRWSYLILRDGCFYGYVSKDINDRLVIQDLPLEYCRSRFYHRGRPAVEFNVRYFDQVTNKQNLREIILGLFPDEIQKAYRKYAAGTLKNEDDPASRDVWIVLEFSNAFKFNINEQDLPPFLNAIPALLNLDDVQDMAKEKMIQSLQKILVQELSLDKNGEIPFLEQEITELNINAAKIAANAVGVNVLTTLANVHLEELDKNSDTKATEAKLQQALDDVYSTFGISGQLFNTNGNLALEKSCATDESYMKQVLLQFEQFFNDLLYNKFGGKKDKCRIKILDTSIFNQKDKESEYKSLTQLGFSRMLPMVAMGHTQKEMIASTRFEQQVLKLDQWMLPPFSSNVMNEKAWAAVKGAQGNAGGRPATSDDAKSDKTIANQASQ